MSNYPCPQCSVETRFGSLNFFDGVPDKASLAKLYDNLDFQRAVQAYLMAIPAGSQVANRNAIRTLGTVNTVVPIFEQLTVRTNYSNSRNYFPIGSDKGGETTLLQGKNFCQTV